MMKSLTIACIALMAAVFTSSAAEPWYSRVGVKGYAALEHPNFDNPEWSAGVDIGVRLNNKVSLHADLTSFAYNEWGGSVVDRASLLGKYELFTSANKAFMVYGIAGGGYNLDSDNWLFRAGLGVSYDITKNIVVFADSTPYSEFNGNDGLSSRISIGYNF